MKSPPFAYARARSLAEVFDLMDAYGDGARLLAGGQSLMPTLNMRLSDPELLIDLNHVAGLGGIEAIGKDGGGGLKIGALTRHVEVERSDLVAARAPLIAAAMHYVAHPAIRNRGTIGGSLALGDPAAELPACMIALGAAFELASRGGTRTVAAGEFYRGLFETALEPGEVLTAVHIPAPPANARHAFDEVVRRHGDFAMTGLAATAVVDGATLGDPQLVFFAVADRPVVATRAAAALHGADISEAGLPAAIETMQQALGEELDPAADLHASAAMKAHLASVLAARAVRRLAA